MAWCEQAGADVLVRVKAVPGASRDQIAGLLGDRLKIRVAAPPEGGKANASICDLLAKTVGVGKRDVTLESGGTHPEKVLRVAGVTVERVSSACL